MKLISTLCLLAMFPAWAHAAEPVTTRGATEATPGLSQYFSWINNRNEGATESQTIANLEFFKWLHDEYGMKLDIYAFDAGIIDGPRYYGSMETDKFKSQFPNGLDPIHELAKSFDCRLGVWLGPDGYGDTAEEEEARREMLVGLCRDYDFALFKMDAVCTQLRPEKQDAFAKTMIECRKHSPDLILLNHRLNLGHAEHHATTFLWEGAETYIDVHMTNSERAGTHNRVKAISRGLVPDLQRLTEDHGVCISSCLDYWEDDLVLQAFNRNLILSPEIYGSPWFLRDGEFPKLARIYNLHRRYREIMVNGMVLDEDRYGPLAVSRGDDGTRLITMRNLEWETAIRTIKLDESIGLKGKGKVEVRQFHPTERIIGTYQVGEEVDVVVRPFRSSLILVDRKSTGGVGVDGCYHEVVRDVPGKDVVIKLLGSPGSIANLQLVGGPFSKADVDGVDVQPLADGRIMRIQFDGKPMRDLWHRQLGVPKRTKVPVDAEALYEATCFASDNDSHETRSLRRSGESVIPQVRKAREEFLQQPVMTSLGILQDQLKDSDLGTHVYLNRLGRRYDGMRHLRLDLGKPLVVTQIDFELADEKGLDDQLPGAEVSADLKTWRTVPLARQGLKVVVNVADGEPVRYLRSAWIPERVAEISARDASGDVVDPSAFKLTWLFPEYRTAKKAWSLPIRLDEAAPGSYLAVACHGTHGVEGAWVALRVGGEIVGAPFRAPSFPVNPFEGSVRKTDKNYSYFIPVTKEMIGKRCELVVLGLDDAHLDFKPDVWLTAYPIPFDRATLTLKR